MRKYLIRIAYWPTEKRQNKALTFVDRENAMVVFNVLKSVAIHNYEGIQSLEMIEYTDGEFANLGKVSF